VFELLHIGQVYVLYRARLVPGSDGRPAFSAGAESLEVGLFDLDRLPFEELAFPVVHFALDAYLADRKLGRPRLHQARVSWTGSGSRFDARNYLLDDYQRLHVDPADE
jgi:hypothetical protein